MRNFRFPISNSRLKDTSPPRPSNPKSKFQNPKSIPSHQARTFMCGILLLGLFSPLAQSQTTQPDNTLDWLLTQPAPSATTTQPTTQPSTQPDSPFTAKADKDALRAKITFSDGTTLEGTITSTPGKPVRLWDDARAEYRDIPLKLIGKFQAEVVWERDQPEWKFIESGSDIKEMTGKTYPARELIYTVTLVNDEMIKGGIVAPLYFTDPQGSKTLVLNKRQKGEVGQTLDELKYVKAVVVSSQ